MVEYSDEQLKRWRLVLGKSAQGTLEDMAGEDGLVLDSDSLCMDDALAEIYGGEDTGNSPGGRSAGSGMSSPHLNKWLGDIRTYFQEDVVAVIQQDAIERKGLEQLLFEPETLKNVQPNLSLVGTLLTLSNRIPDKTKETAREVVRKVVEEIKKHMENELRQAVTGALNRKAHSPIPRADAIDWKATINRNIKNYQPSLEAIVPERVFFFSRSRQVNAWNVIVALDQSGSMADSVVYGAVAGAIFASLPALATRVVAFDTQVVDLTEECGDDPVDMLMGVQLGGGTDINKAVAYCQTHITDPAKTLFILITELIEGGVEVQLVRRMKEIKESGVRTICLLALSYSGIPYYDEGIAKKLANLGVPCFGCTPNKLPELVHGALAGDDLVELAKRVRTQSKKAGSHID